MKRPPRRRRRFLPTRPSAARSVGSSRALGHFEPLEERRLLTFYSDTVMADGPVVYYQFEETSGSVADDAMDNYDGVYRGNAHTVASSATPMRRAPAFLLAPSSTHGAVRQRRSLRGRAKLNASGLRGLSQASSRIA